MKTIIFLIWHGGRLLGTCSWVITWSAKKQEMDAHTMNKKYQFYGTWIALRPTLTHLHHGEE